MEVNQPNQRPRSFLVRFRTPIVVGTHGFLFAVALFSAFLCAYNFRFTVAKDPEPTTWFTAIYLPLLVLVIPIKLLVFYWVGQYRGSWRYVGLRDLFGVTSASLIASFVFLSIYFFLENTGDWLFGRRLLEEENVALLRESTVFLLDWAATVGFVCAAKVLVRFYYEDIHAGQSSRSIRVLIVGAGDAGETIVRQLQRRRRERYICVGFLDDHVAQLHGRIHDVEIIGRTSQIREMCEVHGVEEVFIALPHASPRTVRKIIGACEGTTVRFKTIPAITDLIEGRVQVSQIRDVDITDLLGREQVELDTQQIGLQLRGKRVLVTGAGGSIGSEMCRQIAVFDPARLMLLEQAENNLFEIDRELRRTYPNLDTVSYVGDIIDKPRVEQVFEWEKPSVVFHAAAHKHVPMMEINPGEAIKNNVLGTKTVADACLQYAVQTMVLISTDKAVNPTSVMGCSKRVAELYVQQCNGHGPTQFITVRFGNVLGSSGSVVPIFRNQIAAGGPVTVTDPEMARYFMTIPEAAQLVLQAGTMGKGGEIFTLHMGDPVHIVDLARDMITLSGLKPGVDIEIVFSGKRPGEKLFEELSGEGEDIGDTAHPKIGIWKHRAEDGAKVRARVEQLIERANDLRTSELHAELRQLVPEYQPDSMVEEPGGQPLAEAR